MQLCVVAKPPALPTVKTEKPATKTAPTRRPIRPGSPTELRAHVRVDVDISHGGAVAIDTAPVRDNPEATIAKMQVVKDAALAPASPSMADRRIAAQAEATRLAAIAELAASRRDALEQPEDAPGVTGRLFTQLDRPEPGDELSRAV